jgi:hypothetical protein
MESQKRRWVGDLFGKTSNPFLLLRKEVDQKFDLDVASSSLVKYYDDGRHGATYRK